MAGRIAALAERRREERGFPSSSDPEYHKKLCDLMVDTENWTLNDDAVDALLKIQPQDIQDKAVRQQIARNFRELAMKDSAGNDQGKAIRGLVLYGGKYSVPLLVEILEDQSFKAPAELFDGLASFPDPKGAEALCKQLGNFFNHREAVHALRTMGVAAEDALMKAAPSDDAQTSLAAVELLGEVGTKKSLPLLGQGGEEYEFGGPCCGERRVEGDYGRSRTGKVRRCTARRCATFVARSNCRGESDGGRFDAEDARAERDLLPAGGDGGGDFVVGEAAFGADGELGGERFAQVDLLIVIGRRDGRGGGATGGSLALDPSHAGYDPIAPRLRFGDFHEPVAAALFGRFDDGAAQAFERRSRWVGRRRAR